MSPVPITKVYDADGHLVHDCKREGCSSSWDGYDLETGDPLEGRSDPGPEWDVSRPGIAKLATPPR